MRHQLFGMGAGLALLLAAGAATVHADGQNGPNDNCQNSVCASPNGSVTPELDSIALFGTGVAGLAGYGLLRFRSRRRQDDHQEPPATDA